MPLTCHCVSNEKFQVDGPKAYARSAVRWSIQHSDLATFFVQNNKLMRQGVDEEELDGSGPEDETHETMHAASRQNAMTGVLMHKNNVQMRDAGKSGGGMKPRGLNYSRAFAEVQAKDVQNDTEYVVPVTIGTPGVKLNLDFDTGSSDLWVWSSSIKSSVKHAVYSPSRSRTAKRGQGMTWKIEYADNSSASGDVYFDTVSLQGVTIHNQAVEVASQLSGSFQDDTSSDGLLGLAFPKINTVKPQSQKTPFQQMIEQKVLDKPIFTCKLDKGDSAGFFTFGHVASGVLPRGVDMWTTYVNASNGWWEFNSRGIMIGKKELARPPGNTAIADTGTTLILLDDRTVQAVYSTVRGSTLDHRAGGWILPTDSNPPDIYFACGERYFGIPGKDLKFSDAATKGYSFGAIQSRGSNKQDIFGDVFLKRVYALFDGRPGSPRIGFGQRDFN